jgi:hypothetical protein
MKVPIVVENLDFHQHLGGGFVLEPKATIEFYSLNRHEKNYGNFTAKIRQELLLSTGRSLGIKSEGITRFFTTGFSLRLCNLVRMASGKPDGS